MQSQLTVSVVIPVYRAEQTLADLHRQLSDAMSKLTPVFEIIFVEDGGGDGSWAIIAGLARADHRVRGIRMSRNYGQHNALLCGIRAAKHDIILTMDDDLQHPVSEITPMLAALTPDFDVVYGAPQERNSMASCAISHRASQRSRLLAPWAPRPPAT